MFDVKGCGRDCGRDCCSFKVRAVNGGRRPCVKGG